jgi:hypothetical protein
LATYAIGVLAAAALIAGCSGTGGGSSMQPPSAAAPMSHSSHGGMMPLHRGAQDTFIGAMPIGKVHPDHHKSWVSPAAKGAPRIMFSSDDSNNDVYMFLLPSFKQVGTLTGFSEPQGMCSDNQGNIYISSTTAFQVLKYSRTGTLLATYTDPYGYPVGCAWDPATGNLAVTDIFDIAYPYDGDVLVYTSPSSAPIELRNPAQYFYYFAGYGPGSSLWLTGRDASGAFILSGCGASSCSTIPTSGGTIYFPGAVQWDGTRGEWVVFDQLCNDSNAACSYPVSGSGALGTPTDYNDYAGGAVCDLIQAVVAANGKKYVAGGDYDPCGFATSTYDRWPYTAGGTPTNELSNSYYFPVGAAISTK